MAPPQYNKSSLGNTFTDHLMVIFHFIYFTLYLSLYKIYLQKFIDLNPLIERDIRSSIINSIENLKNYKHHETANYKMGHKETIDFLENINFHGLQDMLDKSLTNQAK